MEKICNMFFVKRKSIEKRREYINQLIDIIEYNDEYKEFIKNNDRYRKIIESSNQTRLWESKILDTYDNKLMNRLVKKLSKLNKGKYKVKLYYRPKRLKDLNYFSLQYAGSGWSRLAEVEFLNDKYIKEITVAFTQINNNQAVVEYNIHFKKIMDNNLLLEFIKENKQMLFNKKFISFLNVEDITKNISLENIQRRFDKLVKETIQAKLMEVALLNFGVNYKLPSLTVVNYPEGLYSKESLRNVFLCKTFEVDNGEKHIIADITEDDGLDMELYFSGKSYSPISFINLLSNYRMDFYYFLFDRIEQCELNLKMNKYFNESKNRISTKDYKWLVNKIRAINDNKLHMSYEKKESFEVLEWKAFFDGKETELDFLNNKYIKSYQTIYIECIEHIKILYSVGRENLTISIATWTLIATLFGICFTIIMSL